MSEDSQQSRYNLPAPHSARHQPGPEDMSGALFLPSQLSKEKLYEQRQKCELRRLLKHTHPELKTLDEVVDEEFAEVSSSETGGTAGETGYEGEVLSRCLIFENCVMSNKVSPYTPKMHKAKGTVKRGDVSKTSAVFKQRPCHENDKWVVEDDKMLGSTPDPNRECEEEIMRIDTQATKRILESQSVNTSTPNPDRKFQGNVSISGDETGSVQKQECSKDNLHSKNKSNAFAKSLDLTNEPKEEGPCNHKIDQSTDSEFSGREEASTGETVFEGELTGLPDPEEFGEIIKTSEALLQNNPFIPANIEREHAFMHSTKSQSQSGDNKADQDYLVDNVKNRAHLFESMPFDKIRHQNKDEIETMVENIKETLNSLYFVNAIHSGGSIIEVNETMIAKKAKFTLSESGPKVNYEEVAEGGAQNFILQLLPRTNLKRQITYLKEGSKGSMKARVMNVPMHQHHFSTNQDTEFKTANVVQLVEDILNQDNSLRKGVVIQEDADKCAEVIVYSLYHYFDEENVKSYCPLQVAESDDPEPERGDVSHTVKEQLRKGIIESTRGCLLETPKSHICQGTIRPEITVKGNVKLFKSCIERGDLEYLKTLQTEPTTQEQELLPNQNVTGQGTEFHLDEAEESSEWVQVDVKRLKNIFSGDQRSTQPKQNAFTCQNVSLGKSHSTTRCIHGQVNNTECSGKTTEEVRNSTVAPQGSCLHLETQENGRVHKAELVKVLDDADEISNLQTAIHSLQQATTEATSKEKHEFHVQQLCQENEEQKEDTCTELTWGELQSASNITSDHKSDHHNTETCREYANSEEEQNTGLRGTEVTQKQHVEAFMMPVQIKETTIAQQQEEEVIIQGKLQAALDSLEKSNINVSRGDFRAAMIYRSISKPPKERQQNMDTVSAKKPTEDKFCLVTGSKSAEAPLKQEVSKEQMTAANVEPPSQSENLNKPATSAASEKSRRSVGPKPVIPPKPEHLKMRDIQSTNTKNPEATQINTANPKDTVPKPLQINSLTSISSKDEHKQGLFKINASADSKPDSGYHERNKLLDEAIQNSQETEVNYEVQGSDIILESDNTDKTVIKLQQDINVTAEEKSPKDFPVNANVNETDESHVDFHEACKKFGGKKAVSAKNVPVKPKRVKNAQLDNKTPKHMSRDDSVFLTQTLTSPTCDNPTICGQTADSKDKHKKQEGKVKMREKKGRTETEDERRQRLSVHMDEIVRGNITTAMEIFDNLRKQEELQSILTRVQEIEQDTSEVDVRSLRRVFENVPEWIVSSHKKKQKKAKTENKEERMPIMRANTENKSSVAHVFGDLERASEEIMNLKEQTLAKLMDIEEAIKKALYSVSTFKSDSDIAGLSCLFKESLGAEQGTLPSGNISKISIGSSKTKQAQESPTAHGNTTLPASARIKEDPGKLRASPPSSPSFISIQSTARKMDKLEVLPPATTICLTCQHSPTTEEKFWTTETTTFSSPAQNRQGDQGTGSKKQYSYNPKRELSVLELQTDHEGNSIMGTNTVKENYERTDNFGKRFYSSRASTGVTGQPEATASTGQTAFSPSTYQITKYTEVQLPINQKP